MRFKIVQERSKQVSCDPNEEQVWAKLGGPETYVAVKYYYKKMLLILYFPFNNNYVLLLSQLHQQLICSFKKTLKREYDPSGILTGDANAFNKQTDKTNDVLLSHSINHSFE